MRELFLKWLQYPKMVSWVLPIEITLSISAFYELIEWAVADVFFKAAADWNASSNENDKNNYHWLPEAENLSAWNAGHRWYSY